MKNLFLTGALLLAIAANVNAWTPANGISVAGPESRASQERLEDRATQDLSMAPPSDQEVFVEGAATFTHAGRNYALKTIFSRATLDPASGLYKPGLRYQFSDYTNPKNVIMWLPINPEKSPALDFQSGFDGTNFHIESDEKKVTITATTNGKQERYKFKVSDLLARWQENALKYRHQIGRYTWHLVPQVVWHYDGSVSWFSRIYVITGEKLFDDATGLPLDAVRLCSSPDNWLGCSIGSIAPSMATGLKIDQNDTAAGGGFKIEEMSVYLMRGILRDELAGNCWHYNCDTAKVKFNNW
jgi:hypothetical protein